jgi:hypothetical protein
MELLRYAGVHRVGLDFGIDDRSCLLRVDDDDLLHLRLTATADLALPAASITTLSSGQICGERLQQARRMSTRRRSVPLERGS